jgi:RimJ/RimL family protein N-acetyltransferase
MKFSVRPALTTAAVVRGLDTDHDRRRGQRCIVLNRPVSLINRGKPVQINRATSSDKPSHFYNSACLLNGTPMTALTDRPTLSGRFVNLRPLAVEDSEITFAWRNGARAFLLNHSAKSVEQQSQWIAQRPPSEFNFIIETKKYKPIGMLSLIGVDQTNGVAESARFLIGDEKTAKGLPAAAEAMKLLYQFAFDSLGLRRVWGMVASDNRLMIKWQMHFGMVQEGRLRNHLFVNKRHQDAVVLGLLYSEYLSKALPRLNALISATGRPEHFSSSSE